LLLRDGCILLRNCRLDLSDRSFLFLALAGLFLYLAMLFEENSLSNMAFTAS
jgi:hypothetical protein